jgi:flagellar hook-associated protein 1 FlgK
VSLSDILSTAISGLAGAQAGLRTVSNNIANVNTPGYARQQTTLTTLVVSGQTNGVVVGEPTRVADKFLEATVYRRSGDYGQQDVTSSYLDRLQALLGAPGADSGLPARLDAINAAATAMTGSQDSSETTAAFTGTIGDAISSVQQLSGDVNGLRNDVESEVGYTVDQVNSLLKQIYDLNSSVSRLTNLGKSTAGPADQRMNALQELSSLVSINVRDQPDGSVTIETASGQTLLDKKLRQIDYPTAGEGVTQSTYPTMDIHFANADGSMGASTGESITSSAVGGKLGGLLDLRDRTLPQFTDSLGTLFGGLAGALNSVSNAGTTVPAPSTLTGHNSGLVSTDALNFTGAANFAVTASDGTLVAKTNVDFSALGPNATIDDAINAINTGLGGAATASFANGKLSITAANSSNGVVVAQDDTNPSSRGGSGFSQFFGLNDIVQSSTSTLVPSGLTSSDAAGFTTGQEVDITLRDATGKSLGNYALQPATGGTVGDLVTSLNSGSLGSYGTFSLDDKGRIRFDPAASTPGATLTISADSTDRFGTGRSFTQLMDLTGASAGLDNGQVNSVMALDSSKVPLARLQDVAVGAKALGAGDIRGATAFVTQLDSTVDLGSSGVTTVSRFAASTLGNIGLQASQASSRLDAATASRDDAVNRRDSFSGVNIDEELSQMVVLQNSYQASARIFTVAGQMYQTLLDMVK